MESRVKEIDYLKCIFITLMIIFHLVYIGDKYPYAKQIVYTFHMSAFLIISGYLANNRKDARSFLRKFLWIFIPYACMEAAYTVMSHFLPVRESVDAITPTVLLDKIFLHPMGPYWYLHTLILCSLIYYITFRYVRLSVVSRLVVTGVCLFALSHWGGLMNFSNALYFLIGMTVSQSGLRFTQVFRATTFAIVPFVILCCFPANLDRGTLAGVAITWLSISLLLAAYGYLPVHNGKAAAAQAAIRIADIVVALGKAVKCTHESAEAGMSRHGRDSAYQCCAETIHQHIADVLPQGKAKRNKHGIDHAVKLAVEFARPPGALSQQQVFEPLL